ncbi:hypothetical protein FHG87_024906 [Trinorchestia longiramus]|nr:hypothetical protein FHG87_024906 [Trinorchestia longiramus]
MTLFPWNKEDCEDKLLRPSSISTALTMLPWEGFSKETNVGTKNNGQKLLCTEKLQDIPSYELLSRKNCSNLEQLPENIVSAGTVNTFKNRLDKFWITNPQYYNVLTLCP